MPSQRRLGTAGAVGRLVDASRARWTDLVAGRRRWRYLVAGARDRMNGPGRTVRLTTRRAMGSALARRVGQGFRRVARADTWPARGVRTVGAGVTGALSAIGADTDDALTAVARGGRRSLGVVDSATGRRFRARGRVRARARALLASPSGRRTAIAAVAGMVVAGVVLGATRLPGGAPSVEQGVTTSGQAGADAGSGRRGPGLTRPGIHLRVTPLGSGDLEVVERLRVPQPVSALSLAAPPPPPDTAGPATRLVDLRVSADDTSVSIAGSTEVEQSRELALPRPATAIELRYEVQNADEQGGDAAPAGRATLSLRPAASGALGSEPVVVQVRGAVVHALVCVDEPRERQLCGVDGAGSWHTQPLTGATSSVLALVDLPGPQS